MKKIHSLRCYVTLAFITIGLNVAIAQETMASWTFDWLTPGTTSKILNTKVPLAPDNGAEGVKETVTLNSEGRSLNAPSAGFYVHCTKWGTPGDKYWIVDHLNTTEYTSITVSSKQNFSADVPVSFKLQYRIGSEGSPWKDVPKGEVTIDETNNWRAGIINKLPLPSVCEKQPLIAIRWILTSTSTIADNTQGRIDNIIISGIK